MPIKRIDHIAVVVPNVEEAANFYQDTLGLKVTHIENVEGQDVIAAFLPAGQSEIELVEPITDDSGVAKFLSKHGPGVHHICLEVENLEATLARLADKGVQLINQTPTIGSGGKKIAFIHPKSTYGVLIELYETTPEEPLIRADILNNVVARIDLERQAVSAGIAAFLGSLRESARLAALSERVMGSTRGIPLKKPDSEEK